MTSTVDNTPGATEESQRIPVHVRQVEYRSFLRPDGLWDIEGTLLDTKAYDQMSWERGALAAGTPIHHMRIRLTIDDAFMIRDVDVSMPATPFDECQKARSPLALLVGVTIGRGWRKSISEAMGAQSGCTHVRELLFGMGTAAFQTVGRYRAHERRQKNLPEPAMKAPRSPLGECIGWAFDGGPMKRHRPEFFQWRPPERGS